jgi:hypothetical protein
MASADDYAAWIVKNADKKGTPDFETVAAAYKDARGQTAAPPAVAVQARATDAPNAVGTGFWRGATRLAGMPVDTVANVIDLGKAGLGSTYTAATGKPAPGALQVNPDRSGIWGSGDNLLSLVRKGGAGGMVDPQNPAYEGGYLQAAGGAATGVMRPNSWLQAGNQLALAEAGGIGSKAVHDATGNNALAVMAGMSPLAAQQAAVMATKRALIGNEQGRIAMQQRVKDLADAGVTNPTLGLATGNGFLNGVENVLQNTPGAVGIMRRARDQAVGQLENTTTRAADLASQNRGAMESGRSIQAGAKTFKDSIKAQQTALYDRLDRFLNPSEQVPIPATQSTLAALNADIPTMPQLSKQFKNSRIVAIEDALKSDMQSSPTQQAIQVTRGGGGLMNAPVTTSLPAPSVVGRTTIPFEALKKTRTLVGNEIADSNIVSDVPRSKWNPLYGSLSEDMQTAANASGPEATAAFNRANNYSRGAMARLDRIAPVVNRDAPEQSFTALAGTLKENASTLQAVKKSLPPDARGDFAGTIIDRLGKAKPGQQNAEGDKWSPETFLTNWNGMKPQARAELLAGFQNAEQVAALVDKVAKSAAMMRDGSKIWANPSGTAANIGARGTLGAIGLGGAGALVGAVSPTIPLMALGGVGAANVAARSLTSPTVRNALMRQTRLDPELLNAQILGVLAPNALNAGQR